MSPQVKKFNSNRRAEAMNASREKWISRIRAEGAEEGQREFARYMAEECANCSYHTLNGAEVVDLDDIHITVNRFMEARGYAPLPEEDEEMANYLAETQLGHKL